MDFYTSDDPLKIQMLSQLEQEERLKRVELEREARAAQLAISIKSTPILSEEPVIFQESPNQKLQRPKRQSEMSLNFNGSSG